MNQPIEAGTWKGFKMFFQVNSYNCPALKLYGYSTDLQLMKAITCKLKRMA